MTEAATRVAILAAGKEERVVYGRYAGGVIAGARDDRDLFPLFRANLSFEVVEPGRPVLRQLVGRRLLPWPVEGSGFDLEPSDEQLREWAGKGSCLAGLVFHSGEMSHDDGVMNVIDLAVLTGVPVGIPVHVQRFETEPQSMEALGVPRHERGALGLAEPMLHSSGWGIIAESLADPQLLAEDMKRARQRIAQVVGPLNVPRGVYCYLDADPPRWADKQVAVWRAVQSAGFEYVLSSVEPGANKVLYRDGDFVVINISSDNFYPASPFVRVNSVDQLRHQERALTQAGGPAWCIGVIDMPIFASQSYLLMGTSLPALHSAQNYPDAHLGRFFDYLTSRGETHRLVPATPHTIARYARLLDDEGLV
jgi:hypothetical protein